MFLKLIFVFLVYRMKLLFAITVLTFLSCVTSAPLDAEDYLDILTQVGTALNLMDDEAIKAYGVDPSILLFRDQINKLIPQDVLKTGQAGVKLP